MATVPRACGHRVRHARGACAVTVGALNLIYNHRVPDELLPNHARSKTNRVPAARGGRGRRGPAAGAPGGPARRGGAPCALPPRFTTRQGRFHCRRGSGIRCTPYTPLDSLTTGKAVAPRALETEPMAQCPNADRRRLTPPQSHARRIRRTGRDTRTSVSAGTATV